MQYYPFDSSNRLYRSKIGAVAAGDSLRLRLLLHRDARVQTAFLRYRRDDGEIIENRMEPAEWLDDYRFYDAELNLSTGLYWYSFRYASDFGPFFVQRQGSLGVFSKEEGEWWQLTVYDADYKTPDWLRGGVIYQIFPDRFYKSGQLHNDVPADRYLCNDWSKQPEYRQTDGALTLGNDYYGGDLAGITEKLPYIASLGVTCIYMNPVFEAHSNHRYNTADYMKIDPMLGTEKDLETLCEKAKNYGISVILDGVFSHTGDDSRYFNRKNRYDTCGAYNNTVSPYGSWYKFNRFPDDYSAWWGVPSLPETNEENPDFMNFITGENGVLRYWMRHGISGWRLDVADELPDAFLDAVRKAIKTENRDAYLLGEVWEDASNKISYGARRRFLLGKQLDSVMNYPFAEAIVRFVRGGTALELNQTVCTILENYPPQAVALLMNHIGTHDTARILTRLGKGEAAGDRAWQSAQVLSAEEYANGVRLLKLAAVLQYTLPGVPSLYYGDEAGMQGYGDPFCRGAFPWDTADRDITEFYGILGNLRKKHTAFRDGDYLPITVTDSVIAFVRSGEYPVLVVVNRGDETFSMKVPDEFSGNSEKVGGILCNDVLTVPGKDFCVLG